MSILFYEIPPDARAFLAKHLSLVESLYERREAGHPMGGQFDSTDIRWPLEVFTPGAASPDAVHPEWPPVEHGWLVFVGDEPPSRTAEIALTQGSNPTKFVFLGLSSGPQLDDLSAKIRGVKNQFANETGSAYCRLFRAQTLNLAALWLSKNNDEEDLFLPLIPVWTPFENRPYSASEFRETFATATQNKRKSAITLFKH